MYIDNLVEQHTIPNGDNPAMLRRYDLANAIRALAMDAVQKANSGHPGMPMGMADIAEVLWNDFLNHNPSNPGWVNRDRFILSNGHGAMLHYALLHLTGYDLSIEDLKQFRQLHSKTPGHPELGYTPGVETTTGPLGQGLANAVGMAIAEKKLAAEFNRNQAKIVDHYTYVFAGDGCLMEGISHEVCSLAGVLNLGKLIVFYDDNGISIDGEVQNWYQDDTPARFRAYGWQVVADVDGHNPEAIKQAITQARANVEQPTLICCKTVIAYGAPNLAGTSDAHGAPLGDQEIALAKAKLGWDAPAFVIPQPICDQWDARERGKLIEQQWAEQFRVYQVAHPELAQEYLRRMQGDLPSDWTSKSQAFIDKLASATPTDMATRKASKLSLDVFGALLPELLGGSADLTGSNLTLWKGASHFSKQDPTGNYIYYGVREFGMFAIMNGLAVHGGFIPYGGTFLTFVDYGKNAVRLSAIMKAHVIYVLTHDSIGLGEDGPTHQPIEQIGMLRLIPSVEVWRPADELETAIAWKIALERKLPSCLLLSRQTLPAISHNQQSGNIQYGGYILVDCDQTPDIILIATGSEVALAVATATQLKNDNFHIRVVSMPCVELFEQQSVDYQAQVLPPSIGKRIVIEAGATGTWYKYIGPQGTIMGIDRFGESAPYQDVYKELGITVEDIIATAQNLILEAK